MTTMSPGLMSAIGLAVIQCSDVTGTSPAEARQAVESYVHLILKSGRKDESEVIALLTGPMSTGPGSRMRWQRLLHDHGRPGLVKGI